MSLDKLCTILPRPNQPVDAPRLGDWFVVEQRLGIQLPSDYKAFINSFGTCMIGRLIRIHSPFTTGSLYSFFDQIDHIRTTRLWYQTTFGKNWCPYPLFPEYDGLLPWANTTAGDHIFWDLSDHTHPWPIVVAESGEPTFEVFPYTMTDFLYHVITGAIDEQSDIISNIDHNHLYDPPGITK